MKHHFIAGGGGFIGSHLCDFLLSRGDSVTVVDNFLTGRRQNIKHLLDSRGFTLIEHDVTQTLPDTVAERKYDTVLDLASPASPKDFATMPLEIMSVGSTGTKNLLELALAQRATFFLASTSEVYGDPEAHPQPESYYGNVDCTGPRSCYDEAKRFSEAMTMAYRRVYDLDIRIARIFNTYGERMRPDDGRVVNTFIMQALRNEPITIFGDGTQTRSFCHVEDEIAGLVAVLDGQLIGPINVGNPGEFTVRELAQIVIDVTGSSSDVVYLPLPYERKGDPVQRRPDIRLISETYGWSPKIALRDGVARMVDWFSKTEM